MYKSFELILAVRVKRSDMNAEVDFDIIYGRLLKKNKLYIVMKDGDTSSVTCEMKSFKVEADTLNIVFEYSSQTSAQDFTTLGFIVVTDRERVKEVKKVSARYVILNQ